MEEAAFTIFSTSFTASLWAIFGGFAWMLIFYCALPILPKWNNFALMSPEAAARAATLRTLNELQPSTAPVRYWN